MASRAESESVDRFSDRYRLGRAPVMLDVERDTLGADYGSTGYTTRAQADLIAQHLHLAPGDRLLDLGAGAGWPGLYLAATTGCRVVATDLPLEGLGRAQARAHADGLADRASFVVGRGHRQPLRRASFDAVVHTDVLCCLGPKLSVLRACRQVLRPGGRLAFTTISIAPDLDQPRLRRACCRGPAQVAGREPYVEMVAHAGFTEVLEIDVTPEYAATQKAWFVSAERHAAELRKVMSPADLAEVQADRWNAFEAIDEGLLRRSLFVAVRPSP